MSLIATTLLEYLAPTFARAIFTYALGGSITANDVGESLSDLGPMVSLIKARTGSVRAARRGSRLFEEAGEIAADNLAELFEREGDKIGEERIELLVQQIATLLDAHALRLLIDSAYNQTHFIREVEALPLDELQLDTDEESFVRRGLGESGRILFAVAEKLPHFERENAARLLENDTQILQEVREAVKLLKQMEAVSKANNPEEKAANFERDYRKLLSRDLDKLNLFGVPQVDDYHQPLTVAFVHVNATQWDEKRRHRRRLHDADAPFFDHEPAKQGSAVELITEAKRMVIVGRAGAGKTTLLKWIAVRAANQDEETPEAWHDKVPFYVRVRDYADKPFPAHDQLPLQYGQSRTLSGALPDGWVEQQLRSGRGIVLLDGLDEVRAEKREAAFAWLQSLLDRFEQATYVISTRPATLEDEATRQLLARLSFEQFRLRALEPDQITHFVTRWHAAMADDACTLPKAEKETLDQLAQQLNSTLARRPQLHDLARNPLLCAMLCALHQRYKRELPNNRVKLYQLCLQTLLDGRDAERGVDMSDYELARDRIADIQPYLGRVAYWMMRHDQSVISRDELTRQLQLPDNNAAATQLVNYLVERSALLQEQAPDEFDFAHRSFQEYLAAERIVHDGDTTVKTFAKRARENRWRDTIRLVAGLGNETDKQNLLQALIANREGWRQEGGISSLNRAGNLVLECYDWMIAPSPKIREVVINYLNQLVASNKLNLSNTDISSVHSIGSLSSLQWLDLSNTAVSDAGLPHLATLPSLQRLDLSHTAVSDAGLPHLATLPSLQTLDLSHTAVSDAGLPHLASHSSLQVLDLSHTAVSNAGLPHLASLSSLQLLDLTQTAVSSTAIAAFKKERPNVRVFP